MVYQQVKINKICEAKTKQLSCVLVQIIKDSEPKLEPNLGLNLYVTGIKPWPIKRQSSLYTLNCQMDLKKIFLKLSLIYILHHSIHLSSIYIEQMGKHHQLFVTMTYGGNEENRSLMNPDVLWVKGFESCSGSRQYSMHFQIIIYCSTHCY